MLSVVFLIDKINLLDANEQYLIYDYLHEEIKANESELLPISRNANDPGKFPILYKGLIF